MTRHHQPSLRRLMRRRPGLHHAELPASLAPILFDNCADALFVIDQNQHLLRINPAARHLLTRAIGHMPTRHWLHYFQLEREMARRWQDNPIVRCLRSQRPQTLSPNSVLIVGGSRHAVQGQVLPLPQQAQVLLYLRLLPPLPEAQSLSRRNEQEMLLQHMSRLNTVSELATGIAHEMNQPLAAIMSFNQASMRLLADDPPDIDRAAQALAEAVNQTRRAAGILERLRAFVGRKNPDTGPVAINQVVINALTLLSRQLSEAGVRVHLRTEPCPPVLADALQLEQVMVNLLRNAAEAMQAIPVDQRRLHIHSHHLAGRVHVLVQDNGPGLPANAPLFTRFFTTKAEGMGLGLSICRSILEAAGGELSASTGSLDDSSRGACFRFSLPARPLSPSSLENPDVSSAV